MVQIRKDIVGALMLLFEADDRIQIHVEHCSICRREDGKLFMHAEYGQASWQDQGNDSEIIAKFVEESELGDDTVSLKWVARQKAVIDRHYDNKDKEAAESVYKAASKRILLAMAVNKVEDPVRAVRIFTGEEQYTEPPHLTEP